MSLEPRGYADKLGNRYEGLWIAYQLLYLMNEDILSVEIESIGDDEEGVDLWIERKDGKREAQQCKIENRSKPDWSMADLSQRGILEKIKFQLDRDSNFEFSFISGTPANMLRDLSRSARDSNNQPEDFYKYQIIKISNKKKKAFEEFCGYLVLNPDISTDLDIAYKLLKRTHFYLFQDNQIERDRIKSYASTFISGEIDSIIPILCDYASNHLRTKIYTDEIIRHLVANGFRLRQLILDNRLVTIIGKLVKQFEESIKPGLIGGLLIPRDEAQSLFDMIENNVFSGLALLYGPAGQGKSGVLYQLVNLLQKSDIPFLPIRIDRKIPHNTSKQFGKEIGLLESPAHTLAALAGSRVCVLMLDQLDALRWTSSHSANALDVCKELIREVQVFRKTGYRISIILSCRTFDLENDPGIKEIVLNTSDYFKIEVKELPEAAIKTVVENNAVKYSQFTKPQKELLRVAQNLAMWVSIRLSEEANAIVFRTSTDLMKLFWKNRYRELEKEGLSRTEVNQAITILVDYMEEKGQLWAPERVFSTVSNKISDSLHSLGIIQTSNNRISFWHQSYFDYQVANRLISQIEQGEGTVRIWLGEKDKQSLFRREQLRQILTLLIDERPEEFCKSICELIKDESIRFHIKHLILTFVGNIPNPSYQIKDYFAILIEDPEWNDHVEGSVYLGHPPYIQSLIEKGIITNWLNNSDNKKIQTALWLLRSVNEKCGDTVTKLLEPYITKSEDWTKWILNTLCFDPSKDSNKMFELRLKLARKGLVEGHIAWPRLVKSDGKRAIKLIEAYLSSWDPNKRSEKQNHHSNFKTWSEDDFKALKKTANKYPKLLWELLLPHVDRLTSVNSENISIDLDLWHETSHVGYRENYMELGIVELCIKAGKLLAKELPKDFFVNTETFRGSYSPIIQRILIESYSELPKRYADFAIDWLLYDKKRFDIGYGYNEPKWMPAVRFIEKLSTICSKECFYRIEDAIIKFHSDREKELATYYLKQARNGYYKYWYGEAQYFLLPALARKRRSKRSEQLIRVLTRKFKVYSESIFLRGGISSGGTITCSIRNVHKLSDKSWINIINNKKIPEEHGKWKQIGPGLAAESSVRQFSNALALVTKNYPERFAQLALKFPLDVHPLYQRAILEGVKISDSKELPHEIKSKWFPASVESIESILNKFFIDNNEETVLTFCRLIIDRSEDNWSHETIQKLMKIATNHPNPKIDELTIRTSGTNKNVEKTTIYNLENNAINCVRGVAARAIGTLLWKHPDWYDLLLPSLEHLVSDPHPAVKIATIEALLPVLNINKDHAVDLFVEACKDDLRVAACHNASQFFNYTIKTHYELLKTIVINMIESKNEEVAEEGAVEVCARMIFYNMFKKEFRRYYKMYILKRKWISNILPYLRYYKKSIPQRRGITKVLAHLISDERYTHQCRRHLLPLFNDPDISVRDEASKMFRNKEILRFDEIPHFLSKYIISQAFIDDPTKLLFTLEGYPDSPLLYSEVIIKICEIFSMKFAAQTRDIQSARAHDTREISKLLLRLYEYSQHANIPKIQKDCLDALDNLFERRVGLYNDLFKEIDQ